MDANTIAAIMGLAFSLGLAIFLGWDAAEGWRKGRFIMRGPATVTRAKQPSQFYASLIYKLTLVGLCLAVAVYSIGRLAGWWGPA